MTLADVTYTQKDAVLIVDVRGEIDLANADALRVALDRRIGEGLAGTVLDLSDIDYIDSTGIQLIFQVALRLHDRGQELAVVLPDGSPAHDALRYAGVLGKVRAFATADEAVAAL